MPNYIATYDRELRMKTLSGVSCDQQLTIEDYIGTHPWDWVPDDEKDSFRSDWERILRPGITEHRVAKFWKSTKSSQSSFYLTRLYRVDLDEIAVIALIYEFSGIIESLSTRELDVLETMGSIAGTKAGARSLDITTSTFHVHAKSIRDKMEVGGDELSRFAVLLHAARFGDSIPA